MDRFQFVDERYAREDDVLQSITAGLEKREMPQISIPPGVGKALYMLVKMCGAHHALEIGGLGGYSSIWLARALPADGHLLTLELEPDYAAFAKENLKKAGLSEKTSFNIGDARKSLEVLDSQRKQFDFFFIDADKESYPFYLEKAIKMSIPGAVIVMDNMFYGDDIFDKEEEESPNVKGILKAHDILTSDERLDSTLLTVGDGLAVARVK
ncbi:Predicted O-methyltransferase YrrM [Marininema mesophilum]|uniref:Predicted O-methyltransferase YrrM n=1 Tax=Marininema mesophilum TaxID=1048340 RepID=A0A1H2QXZ0_9BACL|nr:O-methyltransferase [Marininema mesophilum]SDW12027.1 Predicted O-methyltransferase YrrM [Marininema mesophilum]